MRIRGAKTELEEAGLDAENMASSTAKLREEILALSGVDIMLDNDTFKSTYQILDELAVKWQDLTDIQQASVTELIAGKRQGNVVSSLMTNFDTARQALETSANAEGSAMAEHEKWMQSIEAGLNRIKAAWQSLSQSFLKSKFLTDLLKIVESLIDGFGKLIDIFGTLPTLLTIFASGKSLLSGKGFFIPVIDEATGAAKSITTIFSQAANSIKTSLKDINVNNGFMQSLSPDDINAIKNYSNDVNNKHIPSAMAYEKHMVSASNAAKTYVQNTKDAIVCANGFVKSQQAADVATIAQNKSIGSASALMQEYHSGCKLTGMSQADFAKAVEQTNPKLAAAMVNTKSVKDGMFQYATSLIGAKAATFALQAATMLLNAALTMGISLIVSSLFSAIQKWINKEKELAEQVDELTSKFKEQHKELTKNQSSFKSEATRYAQLSKGVDQLGRNVSLTTDEYSEYQSVVNKIAEQIPSLISGYDDQGNAILGVKGNVDELIEAYEKLLHVENNKILSKAGDIEKNFKNTVEDSRKRSLTGSDVNVNDIKLLEKSLTSGYDDYYKLLDYYDEAGNVATARLKKVLEDADIQVDDESSRGVLSAIVETVKNDPSKIKGIIESYYAQFDEAVGQQKSIAQAKLSEAFDVSSVVSGLDYGNISGNMQNVIRQMVNDFDYEFFTKLIDDGTSVESYIDNMLKQLGNLDKRDSDSIDAAFNLQTKFNNADISYGEFVHGLEDAGKLIDTLNLTDEIKSQLKLTIGLNEKGLVEEYEALIKRITTTNKNEISKGNIIGLGVEEANKFIDSLSEEELSVITDIIPELDANSTVEQIQAAIDREVLLQGLAIDLNIEVETTGLDALNTAIAESKSATGLTAESIDALKARYKDLDGYNVATLFEETANGIRLNSSELSKLESEYKKINKQDLDETLEKLVGEYDRLTSEINGCQDASKRADLYAQRNNIIDQINDTATLAAQYEGLTSAYKEWQSAQEAGQDRDQYESIISGRQEIEEEMTRGWLDDAAIEYLELLSGKDLSTEGIDAQIAAYKNLDKAIGGSKYSIWDFFTEDDDGNSTSDGVYNFFEAVKSVAGETAAYVKDGKYNFDFEGFEYEGKTGDAAIAAILGTSEELVQIMLKAAEDAGFVINIKGDYTELANLKDEAEVANDRMKELGVTTYTFNFDSTDVKDLNEQIAEAEKMLVNLKNDDGTLKVGVSEEDYRQAQDMIAALVYQKQSLDDSAVLHVDTSQANSDIEVAISRLQDFKKYANTLELQTSIGADTSEATTNIQATLNYINGLNPTIKTGLGIDAEEVQTAINNIQTNISAGVAIKQEDLDVVNATISSISNDMMVELGLDTALIDNYKETEHTAEGTVNWNNNIQAVTDWINQTHEASGTVNWNNNTENVKTTFFGNGVINWTVSEANGTANANGTAFANGSAGGKAFKQGNWGINGNGTALGGELGTEILVRDGRWYTIGDSGAEFFNYRKGDIIFNHKQTEELLSNGKVTSNGGRGKAFAEGSAFAYGSNAIGGQKGLIEGAVRESVKEALKEEQKKEGSKANGGDKDAIKDAANNNSKSKGSSSSAKDFKESFDWIEVAIDRIERAIDNLDQKANNVYKSWSDRNSALTQEIGKVREEIELQEDGAQRYLQEANKVGLSSSWAEKVRNGKIDINTIKDEKLAEKIKDYQTWYEKYLACIDAAEKLRETEAKLYAQRVENVATQYEGILGVIEHEKNILDEYISQNEANAQLVSVNYYNALANNERANLSKLEEQKAKMIAEMQAAMASGTITEGSEAWYDMVASIDEVTLAITESNTQLIEYSQTIQQLSWERFDLLQEKISSVTEETEFLIELMSSDKLYDDNGQLTNSGMATMGQHGVAYNTNMYQAELASAEAARLKAELAKDPFDTELEERYREMVSLQQEHILAAQGEKEAIREMVEEGINLELDALQERIDKYNEAIESQKELYDYQNKVKEQTEEIASLEKQMASYAGDTSEEAKAKIQELKVSLDDAKSELEETEYDKRISDQQQMLDELYEQYEEVLNTRLDNLDALVSDMITQINTDATSISTTLSEKVDSVGYTLSESMNTIWDANSTKINGVIADYGNKFMTAQTTTNNALNTINANLQNMIGQLNSIAKTKVKAASISSIANPDNPDAKKVSTKTQQPEKTPTTKTVKVGGKIDAGNAKIYDYAGDKSGETQYFKKDPVYKVLAEKDGYLKVLWHKLSSGVTGWFKKSDVKALATGAKRIDADDMAWTQENGREFIVRPSDGAILTPVAKGDSVLNAAASGNIWSMANSPAEFIRDNLNLNATSVPNNSNVQNVYNQTIENVTLDFKNVKNYEEMLHALKDDRRFEKLVTAMTIDRIAGKSSLAKGKSIRN